MKTRMTFRLAPDVAQQLRQLTNQTKFVEDVLRDALGVTCPACGGRGRVTGSGPTLPNFREAGLPRLNRETAVQLKQLVRLGRELAASELRLEATDGGYRFVLSREEERLCAGTLVGAHTEFISA